MDRLRADAELVIDRAVAILNAAYSNRATVTR